MTAAGKEQPGPAPGPATTLQRAKPWRAVPCPAALVAGCDFSNQDLSGKVFSGVLLQGADLSNTKVVGSQFARAQAQGAILVNTNFTDTNLYGT